MSRVALRVISNIVRHRLVTYDEITNFRIFTLNTVITSRKHVIPIEFEDGHTDTVLCQARLESFMLLECCIKLINVTEETLILYIC